MTVGANNDGLYRVLRALVSIDVFSEPQPRTIALSPAAELLRRDVAGNIHAMVLWSTLVVDMVLPADSRPHPAKLLDLLMLIFPGGRERTEQEWRELLSKAGFTITRIVPTKTPDSVIEATIV